MQDKSCFGNFLKYSVLSILGTLGVSCYILADTYFISKGMGTKGLAALNIAIPLYNFIYGAGIMLGMGGATKFSFCKGADRDGEGNTVYTNTVYCAAVISVIFVLLGLFFSKPITALFGADSQVFGMANIYIKVMLLFAPAFVFNCVLMCFVRNDSAPQLVMYAMLAGSFSNIILDYIFIFPLEMGIFGAVLATGFSPVISIAVMLPHWLKRRNTFHFKLSKIRTDIVKQDISLGFPSLIAQLSIGIVIIVFNILIGGIMGNTGIAAYGVVANISLVVLGVFTGIAQGVQPLVSLAHGRNNRRDIQKLYKYSLLSIALLSSVFYILLYIFASPVTKIFNSENNPQLQTEAVRGLRLYFTSMLFAAYNLVVSVFFTSTERTLPAHILSLLRGLLLIIPASVILSHLFGMTGIWLAFPLTELITASISAIIYSTPLNRNRK